MRFKILTILIVLLLLTFSFSKTTFSDDSSEEVTLSDAVYADLALQGYLGDVSVFAYNGNDLDTISIDAKKQWLPASTIKTIVAMYAYDQIAKGKLHLDDQFSIEDKNDVPTELVTDELPELQVGDYISLRRLIEQMITQSDNTAYNCLLDILGRDNITVFAHTIGLKHTYVGSKLNLDTSQEQNEFNAAGYGINTTTAEDYAHAFYLIKKNKILGAKDLYDIFTRQKINDMIPLLLPKNITIAHKTGDLAPLYHDGGIIEAPTGTYIVSIFSNANDPDVVAHISELIYTKNFDLVGVSVKNNSLGKVELPPLDPLVMNTKEANKKVLGASTSYVVPPDITAADLGMTAKDLSLNIPDNVLPKVIIPSGSPLHIFLPAWEVVQYLFAPGSKAREQVVIDGFKRQIAEAKDLVHKGNVAAANQLIAALPYQLDKLAQNASIVSDANGQTSIQAIAQTSISILGSEYYKERDKAKKLQLIKTISKIAQNNVSQIEPFTPKAINAKNPAQHILLGEVIDKTDNTMTVKTAGGQIVSVPVNNPYVKTRSYDNSSSSSAAVALGTTVALAGSSTGNKFVPSFILAKVPSQLIAPVPVIVAKVNIKNKTIVAIENGVPLQVNITKDTIIKAKDTSVPLSQIKVGNTVMIYGSPVKSHTESNINHTSSTVSTENIPPTDKTTNNNSLQSNKNPNGNPTGQVVTVSTQPANTQQVSNQTKPVISQAPQPVIIEGKTVQVIETKPAKPESNPQPQKPQPKAQHDEIPPPQAVSVGKKK